MSGIAGKARVDLTAIGRYSQQGLRSPIVRYTHQVAELSETDYRHSSLSGSPWSRVPILVWRAAGLFVSCGSVCDVRPPRDN